MKSQLIDQWLKWRGAHQIRSLSFFSPKVDSDEDGYWGVNTIIVVGLGLFYTSPTQRKDDECSTNEVYNFDRRERRLLGKVVWGHSWVSSI